MLPLRIRLLACHSDIYTMLKPLCKDQSAPRRLPVCIRTFMVSSGWIVLCDAARAIAPATTSWAGLSGGAADAGGEDEALLTDASGALIAVACVGGYRGSTNVPASQRQPQTGDRALLHFSNQHASRGFMRSSQHDGDDRLHCTRAPPTTFSLRWSGTRSSIDPPLRSQLMVHCVSATV